ncbi:MAG TPA: TonB family protein [Lysobacter sp.]
MSTPSPATPQPPRPPFDFSAWRPSRRALLWILGAFALGLVLFALVWSDSRDNDFYRAGPNPPTSARPDYAPLPAPLPADSDDAASGMGEPARTTGEPEDGPRLVETAPPPPPPMPAAPVQQPRPAPSAASQPEPTSTPAPKYPAQALRRRESGTVMVRAEIGPDGVPTSINVVTSSGSRALDRAAADAVRRWRFRPAMANGQPTVGSVQVPITFDPNR